MTFLWRILRGSYILALFAIFGFIASFLADNLIWLFTNQKYVCWVTAGLILAYFIGFLLES